MCKPLAEGEREQRLTSLAARKLKVLETWDWGRVLTYVYWLCLVCWVMIFFSKMTVCIYAYVWVYNDDTATRTRGTPVSSTSAAWLAPVHLASCRPDQ